MQMNDSLTSPDMEKTAQFFNPARRILKSRTLKKLEPISGSLCQVKEFDIPTFSRKISQQEIFDFDQVVQQQLQKYNSQPNILQPNYNYNNLVINNEDLQKKSVNYAAPLKNLLGFQQRLLHPQNKRQGHDSLHLQSNKSTPEKGRRNIKVLLNPFNQERKSSEIPKNRNSSQSLRPSKSQGKSFLQRKAQLGLLNRIFSSRSQNQV